MVHGLFQFVLHIVIPQEQCAFVEKALNIQIVQCQSHVDFKSSKFHLILFFYSLSHIKLKNSI